jgi:Domain of Unknown Function with PDB structure (DUF3857)/Domain of Unknown Function with PDB structure (DUF3858)/Transglutaminase-like superfamily
MISRRSIACLMPVLCLCVLQKPCFAQDRDKVKHTLDKISPADFVLPSTPIIDSNTHAVILSDQGEVHYIGNDKDWFSCVYTRQTRIKILHKTAFGLATVSIDLYGEDEKLEKLSHVAAVTCNIENGQVIELPLDSKDVFITRRDKEHRTVKFSLPGVKEGSIIEYTYTTISDYWAVLPAWRFQWEDCPCLSSEYQVEIPQTLGFIMVRQGVHSYAIDKGSTGHASYAVTDKGDPGYGMREDEHLRVDANTIKHNWVIKNVPAFGNESFLTTPDNYIDKIDFQLARTYNGDQTTDHTNNWATATEELLTKESFGAALKEDNSWVDQLSEKIGADGAPLEQARAIYYYVSQHFTCTNHYDKYIETGFKDVIHNNSGTVGEINLLLIALLRKRGMEADPVVLSTREFGFNLATYPVLDRMNYVVVRLSLGGKVYYLDAAHPQLGFGQLPGNCYNGHARIISNRDSASVYFWADSLKESKVTMVLIDNTDKGLEGTLQSTLGPQESYELRREVAEHGQAEYFKGIQTLVAGDADISNAGIDSLTRLEDPVKVHYDFTLKQPPDASVIYLNPILAGGWRDNPFQAADRKYPVEMPYTRDETYVLSMDIPPGYVVDEIPKSAKVAFNGDQGYFEYLLAQQGDKIQMRCRVRLNKALFPPEDYSSLRDFFAFIVKKENEQIVLKKK